VKSDIRFFSFGYSDSFDKKKQYVQSMLQVEPLGLASKWKPGGAFAGKESVIEGIFVSPFRLQTATRFGLPAQTCLPPPRLGRLDLSIDCACCYLSSFSGIAQGSLLD
jgi:hypothetical protein